MRDLFTFDLDGAGAGLLASAAIALAAGCLGFLLASLRRSRRPAGRPELDRMIASIRDGLPAGVLVAVLDHLGRLQFASQKALAALGLPNGDSWRGKSFTGLSCWDEPAEARHALARAILKAEMGKGHQLPLMFVSGNKPLNFVFDFQPQIGLNGDSRCVVITALEISALSAVAPSMFGRSQRDDSIGPRATALQAPAGMPNLDLRRPAATSLDPDRKADRDLVESMFKLLPTSKTLDEAVKIVTSYLARLFPSTSGTLFMQKKGASGLHGMRSWGPIPAPATRISSDDCWALRHNDLHWVEDPEVDLSCTHNPSGKSACLPLVVRGEMVGVLFVAWTEACPDRSVLQSIAEPLASALAQTVTNFTLREQATKDPLTGLLNRQVFESELDRLIHRSREDSEPASMLMMDIDHFKAFNDRFGHDAGDLVLKSVASRVNQAIRASDLAFRFGGEELVVLLPGCGTDQAVVSAKRIQRLLAELTLVNRGERLPPVTISIGVSTYPTDSNSAESLFQNADAGVYAAKAAGRNTVVHQIPAASAA